MGYVDYYLIVWDFIQLCKNKWNTSRTRKRFRCRFYFGICNWNNRYWSNKIWITIWKIFEPRKNQYAWFWCWLFRWKKTRSYRLCCKKIWTWPCITNNHIWNNGCKNGNKRCGKSLDYPYAEADALQKWFQMKFI